MFVCMCVIVFGRLTKREQTLQIGEWVRMSALTQTHNTHRRCCARLSTSGGFQHTAQQQHKRTPLEGKAFLATDWEAKGSILYPF